MPPRVIVTRPEPDASRFADELALAGFQPILSPVLEISVRAEAVNLAGIGAIAFTSANGVRAYRRTGGEASGLVAFAVGDLTAVEARGAGFANVVAANGAVASLAEVIARARAAGAFQGSVLHISGDDVAGNLVGALAAQGIPAERAVLYEARALPDLTDEAIAALSRHPPAEWVALFSPRSATAFLSLANRAKASLTKTRAACLSAAVAGAASRASWESIEIASERTGAGLIRLMQESKRS